MRASSAAPTTPAAGPDSIILKGRSAATSVRIDALRDLAPQAARDKRRRFPPANVVKRRHPQSADLEHVPESRRRDQANPCPLTLEDGVRGDGGSVHELAHGRRPQAAAR